MNIGVDIGVNIGVDIGVNSGVVVSHPIAELGEAGRALLRELLREHRRLHEVVLQLHDKHHRVSMEVRGRLSHGGLPPDPPHPSLGGVGWDVVGGGVVEES